MRKRKEGSLEFSYNSREHFESYYSNGNKVDLLDLNEDELLTSDQYNKHLIPINSKNLFVYLFLLVAMNLGLAILVLIS